MRTVKKRYLQTEQVLRDNVELHRMPGNIHQQYVNASVLLFEDSIYNFDAQTLTEAFRKTGGHHCLRVRYVAT